MIEISKAAISEINRMQKVRGLPNSKFRLGVAAGGCKDFYYTLDFVPTPAVVTPTGIEDDNRDLIYEVNGISVSINRQHSSHLDRLKLDYSEDLMGGGFRFQNPQATSVCGCGNSFSIANYQAERWQLPT
jgi:iron-sulfur cluster assembly protein